VNQEELENGLMTMFLSGNEPLLKDLRDQYSNSRIKLRKYTGAGFYTYFTIKQDTKPLVNRMNFEITDISATVRKVKYALGFVLFIRNGYIDWLEGYTMSLDDWPDDYSNVELFYSYPEGKRDYNELRKKWLK
jgi:hypothetical protein